MEQYKTIKIIEEYDKLTSSVEPTEEDFFFIENIALYLADELLYDFGKERAKQLGKILLAITE